MSRIWIFGESRWQLAWSGCILSVAVIFGLVAGLSFAPSLAEAQAFKTLDEPVGMVFNYIEQDSVEDFEQVMARLGQVMAESENPERVQQGIRKELGNVENRPKSASQFFYLDSPAGHRHAGPARIQFFLVFVPSSFGLQISSERL